MFSTFFLWYYTSHSHQILFLYIAQFFKNYSLSIYNIQTMFLIIFPQSFLHIIFFSTTRKSCFGCAIGISGALHIIYKNNIIKSVHRKYLFRILLTLFDSRNYVFTITTFIFYSSLLIVLSINHKRVLYRNRYFKLNCFY